MIKLNGKILLIAAMICSTIGFSSCGSTPTTNSNNAVVVSSANNAKPAVNDAPKTTTTGDSVGVAECDEYIAKYEVCLTDIAKKAPQAEPMLKSSFEQQRKAFKDAAATPQGKEGLAKACKQAIETAKQTTTAYACKW